MSRENKIGAIIVLYNPLFEYLNISINRLLPQVDLICLIDNSSVDNHEKFVADEKIKYLPLFENVGIAKAQNIGIRYLEKNNFDFVLFSDQDSRCDDGMVQNLFDVYTVLENEGYKIAAIGPTPINEHTSKPYITNQNNIKTFEVTTINRKYKVLEMFSIISSYSLVRVSLYKEIGYLDEKLFIDGVDDEWCWRARYYNKRASYMVRNLVFSHFQGEDTKLPIKKPSPFRAYWQFRNFLILVRLPQTPRYWILRNIKKFSIKLFAYPILLTPRYDYLKNILKGIRDGIKMGRI